MKVHELLTRDEIRALSRRSNLRGALDLTTSWGIIVAAFATVAAHPTWRTIVVAMILIGGRQLGLAVLMHEAAHRTLFESRALNDWCGRWLCAAPIWNRVEAYRTHHIGHHSHTGTERDPDRSLVVPFPVAKASLARKLLRDITGIAGVKRVVGQLLMDAGVLEYTASPETTRIDQRGRSAGDVARTLARNLGPTLLFNLVLLGVFAAIGRVWLYALWAGSWLTTYSLFLRVRSIAEHACTEWSEDPLRNTRTIRAGLIARLTVAPHHVGYHIEHHLLVSAPHWALPRMHRMLTDRGLLDGAPRANGYIAALRQATLSPNLN